LYVQLQHSIVKSATIALATEAVRHARIFIFKIYGAFLTLTVRKVFY